MLGFLVAVAVGLTMIAMGVALAVAGAPLLAAALLIGAGLMMIGIGIVAACDTCDRLKRHFNYAITHADISFQNTLPFNYGISSAKATIVYLPGGNVKTKVTIKPWFAWNNPQYVNFLALAKNIIAQLHPISYRSATTWTVNPVLPGATIGEKWDVVHRGDWHTTFQGTITYVKGVREYFEKLGSVNPEKVSIIPLGLSINATKLYAMLTVVDGETGAIKSVAFREIEVPVIEFRYEIVRSEACRICPWANEQYGHLSVFGLPYDDVVLRALEEALTFEIWLDDYVRPGDQVKLYVGSPAVMMNILALCCKSKNPPKECESVKDLCGQVCSSGYYLFPQLFVSFVKSVGFWDENVLRAAKFLSKVGYIGQPGAYVLTNKDISSSNSPFPITLIGRDATQDGFPTATVEIHEDGTVKKGGGDFGASFNVIKTKAGVTVIKVENVNAEDSLVVGMGVRPSLEIVYEDSTGQKAFARYDPYGILDNSISAGAQTLRLLLASQPISAIGREDGTFFVVFDVHGMSWKDATLMGAGVKVSLAEDGTLTLEVPENMKDSPLVQQVKNFLLNVFNATKTHYITGGLFAPALASRRFASYDSLVDQTMVLAVESATKKGERREVIVKKGRPY